MHRAFILLIYPNFCKGDERKKKVLELTATKDFSYNVEVVDCRYVSVNFFDDEQKHEISFPSYLTSLFVPSLLSSHLSLLFLIEGS